MAISDSVPESTTPGLRQNWILGPTLDFLLIIAAPVLGLLWAIATYHLTYFCSIYFEQPAEVAIRNGITAVLSIFMVFNVAHHLPTFIRIYGDRDLVRRFRWSLYLGPVIPLLAAAALASYVIYYNMDITVVLYINLILVLWDPWHFLMQHYGFMRIYDRHNAAPRKIAARMDLAICGSWFVFIMIATADWLPDILYGFHLSHGVRLLDWLPMGGLHVMEWIALVVAIAMSIVYLAYLNWCRVKGYYVSFAKVFLVLITFAVMYLTYVPNPLIRSLVHDWTFSMGFAALGMVHVSQYLAIVWKYNRSLARRQPGVFAKLFGQKGHWMLLVLVGYVIACLIYGFVLSSTGNRIIVMKLSSIIESTVLPMVGPGKLVATLGFLLKCFVVLLGALVFTSTLLHYYYDGFIWKVRHKENRQNLAMMDSDDQSQKGSTGPHDSTSEQGSWWERRKSLTALATLGWHCIYFLVPIAILTATFFFAGKNRISPVLTYENRIPSGQFDLENLFNETRSRLSIEEKLAGLRPQQASYWVYAGELHFLLAKLRRDQISGRGGPGPGSLGLLHLEQEDLEVAERQLKKALECDPPFRHRERKNWSRKETEGLLDEVRVRLKRTRKELKRTRKELKEMPPSVTVNPWQIPSERSRSVTLEARSSGKDRVLPGGFLPAALPVLDITAE